VGGIDAKVAFLSPVLMKIPDGPTGIVWASFHALHAADAFFRVDSSDVPMLDIDRQRFLGAGFQASGIDALPARLQGQVIRKFSERILYYLDPGQRQILFPLMDQGTSKHAGHTPLTFFRVDQEISLGYGNPGLSILQHYQGRRRRTGNTAGNADQDHNVAGPF
jgi:hypothetical protein